MRKIEYRIGGGGGFFFIGSEARWVREVGDWVVSLSIDSVAKVKLERCDGPLYKTGRASQGSAYRHRQRLPIASVLAELCPSQSNIWTAEEKKTGNNWFWWLTRPGGIIAFFCRILSSTGHAVAAGSPSTIPRSAGPSSVSSSSRRFNIPPLFRWMAV